MTKVLLFDFDGTIADSFENFLDIVQELTVKYKLPSFSPDEIPSLRAQDARSLIKRFNIPFYKIPFMARDMKRMQLEQLSKIKPFKGMKDALQQLKDNGYTLGILTSNAEHNVKLFLKNNKIDVFTYVYSNSSVFGKDKALRRFLRENDLKTDEVIYIGDEIRDIQACTTVGIPIISVTWGFNSKEGLSLYNPHLIANTPKELISLVRNE